MSRFIEITLPAHSDFVGDMARAQNVLETVAAVYFHAEWRETKRLIADPSSTARIPLFTSLRHTGEGSIVARVEVRSDVTSLL